MPNIGLPPLVHVSTVTFQFSSVSWLDKWSGESSSRLLCRRPLWTFLAWAGMSTLWCYPFRISSATQGALKDGFGESVAAVWHFRTMRVSVYWRLSEDVPVVPQRSWSCSTPSRWSWAPSRSRVSRWLSRYIFTVRKTYFNLFNEWEPLIYLIWPWNEQKSQIQNETGTTFACRAYYNAWYLD